MRKSLKSDALNPQNIHNSAILSSGAGDPSLRDPMVHLHHVGADRDDLRAPAAQLLRVLVGQHDPGRPHLQRTRNIHWNAGS